MLKTHWPSNALAAALALALAQATILTAQGPTQKDLPLTEVGVHLLPRAQLQIQWLDQGAKLWYRLPAQAGALPWVMVDSESGQIQRAANARDLALPEAAAQRSSQSLLQAGPSRSGGAEVSWTLENRLAQPVQLQWLDFQGQARDFGQLAAGAKRQQHSFSGHRWRLLDAQHRELAVVEVGPPPLPLLWIDGPATAAKPLPTAPKTRPPGSSPDGRHLARIVHGRLELDGRLLANDGPPFYGQLQWSPDSKALVAHRAELPIPRKITLVHSQRPAGQRFESIEYIKPGDDLPQPELVIVRQDGHMLPLSRELYPQPFCPGGAIPLMWSADSRSLRFDYNARGHQLFRVLQADAQTGALRCLVEERSPTFIDYTQKTWRHWLESSGELLWMSERSGHCHLWLVNAVEGGIKRQITQGPWVVRKVLKVDESNHDLWFMASGLRAEEDPYHQHLCRVNWQSGKMLRLTQGDGNHHIEFSPDGRCFVDRYSRADLPPIHELRRSTDGALLAELERENAKALLERGWMMPERLVAKARDGHSDIHGILIKPPRWNQGGRHPVVEEVYAGPHGSFAPKDFELLLRLQRLAALGMVVVKADGLGTNHRGKAFHDHCWKNLKDAGFPDRIAWIKAAAGSRPWMDLTRVGIFGGSAGGQSAMRALIDHHDFYKVAVADCGCHDNRMDKIWWNEQWMGWPLDASYSASSNLDQLGRLRGELLLIVGEVDNNVDPASTWRIMERLDAMGRPFERLTVLGAGHGAAETPLGNARRSAFLVKHLLGKSVAGSHDVASSGPPAMPAKGATFQLEGWTLHRHPKLDESQLQAALPLLREQLRRVLKALPATSAKRLQSVPLWLSPPYPDTRPRAEYHPAAQWLREHGRNPAMARAVEISNLGIFAEEDQRMPMMLLHELAHAWHDLVLGRNHPALLKAFADAQKQGRYERVSRRDAKGRLAVARAYAMNNAAEYFAEGSEAWFGVNDFQPFERRELQQMDPQLAGLMPELWSLPEARPEKRAPAEALKAP
jgi:dipeptidyl aminopeptidase/acylaminoacyl peptidase